MSGTIVDGLSPVQEKAIVAMMAEPSLARAAAACEVNERTLYRWLREPGFKSAYRSARREAFTRPPQSASSGGGWRRPLGA